MAKKRVAEMSERERFEQAVTAVAKSLDSLVRATEKSAPALTEDQVAATFGHLFKVLVDSKNKAVLSLSIGQTSQGFDLNEIDMELQIEPDFVAPVDKSPPTALEPPQPRLVGDQKTSVKDDDISFMD